MMLSEIYIVACISMIIFYKESLDEWSDVYFDKKHSLPATISDVEDIICQRWKEYVNCGRWVTFDKSRVAGWYNIAITIGPIWKGVTIHSLCVLKGDLVSYKLHALTFGCKVQRYCYHTKICDTVEYFP
jgi:hypothetical protein